MNLQDIVPGDSSLFIYLFFSLFINKEKHQK